MRFVLVCKRHPTTDCENHSALTPCRRPSLTNALGRHGNKAQASKNLHWKSISASPRPAPISPRLCRNHQIPWSMALRRGTDCAPNTRLPTCVPSLYGMRMGLQGMAYLTTQNYIKFSMHFGWRRPKRMHRPGSSPRMPCAERP